MSNARIIRKHPLAHIPELKVAEKVLRVRYDGQCRMFACEGQCCRLGADVDLGQYRRILEHADLIRRQMGGDQEHANENWFSEKFADADFPSGEAVSTRVRDGRCVFLNGANRCVLHVAEQEGKIADLKPFFCRAYPLCIEDGVLTLDEHVCSGETGCCGAVERGPLTIFDLCAFELEYVLGMDGARELRAMAHE